MTLCELFDQLKGATQTATAIESLCEESDDLLFTYAMHHCEVFAGTRVEITLDSVQRAFILDMLKLVQEEHTRFLEGRSVCPRAAEVFSEGGSDSDRLKLEVMIVTLRIKAFGDNNTAYILGGEIKLIGKLTALGEIIQEYHNATMGALIHNELRAAAQRGIAIAAKAELNGVTLYDHLMDITNTHIRETNGTELRRENYAPEDDQVFLEALARNAVSVMKHLSEDEEDWCTIKIGAMQWINDATSALARKRFNGGAVNIAPPDGYPRH